MNRLMPTSWGVSQHMAGGVLTAAGSGETPDPQPSRPTGHLANLRGSSGMLVGYATAQAVNFMVQIGIVRHLSKTDYGAFAWALAVVMLLEALVPLGLDRAGTRFLAMYDEHRNYGRLFGLIFLEGAVLVTTGAVVVAAPWLLQPLVQDLAPSTLAAQLLLMMIALAPVQALDNIVVDMFAVFARPWSVFVRRYLLHPLSRLLVVVLMVTLDQGPVFLAVGFVVAAAVGLVLFVLLAWRLFREIGLAAQFSRRDLKLPVREVAVFCGPVLLGSVAATATTEFPPIVLGDLAGDAEVANFRAVLPFALLNLAVLFSFTTLYTPAASRALARGAIGEVRLLYWQNALWISVLTFPVLAMTTAFAQPLTVAALGARYESSSSVLAVLAIACYMNATLGFNGLTVQLLQRTAWILVANGVTLVVVVVASYGLVRLAGASGAALAVLLTVAVHNLLKQLGLGFGAGVGVVDRAHTMVQVGVGLLICGLGAIQAFVHPPLLACIFLSGVAWVVLLRASSRQLQLWQVFPEMAGWRPTAWLLGSPRGGRGEGGPRA
jgi:O-antigen/teichoic acid export membrane protein